MTENVTEEKLELFAFWSYDLYPFVLGGQFTRMDGMGRVYVPNYQSWFAPMKILPLDTGKELFEKLMTLRDEHGAETDLLDRKFNAKAVGLLPDIVSGYHNIRLPEDIKSPETGYISRKIKEHFDKPESERTVTPAPDFAEVVIPGTQPNKERQL